VNVRVLAEFLAVALRHAPTLGRTALEAVVKVGQNSHCWRIVVSFDPVYRFGF